MFRMGVVLLGASEERHFSAVRGAERFKIVEDRRGFKEQKARYQDMFRRIFSDIVEKRSLSTSSVQT